MKKSKPATPKRGLRDPSRPPKVRPGKTKPGTSATLPLDLLKWAREEAARRFMNFSGFVAYLISEEKKRVETPKETILPGFNSGSNHNKG